MSATVDNRIVDMRFDNQQFEKGVKQSTESLDALKKSLDLTESAKNISNLSSASKGFSLAHMAKGVDHISSRFSALGVVGFTIIQNLTNAAISYGKKLFSSILTPMRTGFQEYETQINAIQTVLANTESKGTTLEDVSAALAELNTYADKTIYNFTEMTRNIGTFTAAGVDLETSTAAIKGIANLAAVSGSNSQQASTAMYQLSQALSSGTVKLMDWNSVVNAGMGGQVFQDALKETARVSGIAIDDLIDKHGSFRETLSTGWLSSQVLLDTLAKFTGDLSKEQLKTMGYNEEQIEGILRLGQTANDAATKVKTFTQLKDTLAEALQSGWTRSWEIIIGDFEEAKAFYTEVSDTLGAMIQANADARNAVLESWKDAGGRRLALDALRNAFNGVLSIMAPIKEAFNEVFPPVKNLGVVLRNLTYRFEQLTKRLILNEETADKVKRIFKGLFSVLSIAKDFIVGLLGVLFDLGKSIDISGGGILDFLANIGDSLNAFRENIKEGKVLEKFFANLKNYITIGAIGVTNFVKILVEKFRILKDFLSSFQISFDGFGDSLKEKFEAAKEAILSFFGSVGKGPKKELTIFEGIRDKFAEISDAIKKGLQSLSEALEGPKETVGKLFKSIGEGIVAFFTAIKENWPEDLNLKSIFAGINAGVFAALLLAIRNFFKSGSGVFDEIGGVFEGVTEILDGVGGSLQAWQQSLKAKTLVSIAIAIGIIALSLIALTFIDAKKLTVSLGIITGLFANLMASMAVFSKTGGGGAKATAGLLAISAAVLILSLAMAKIASIDEDKMGSAIKSIFALIAGITAFALIMSKNSSTISKGIFAIDAVAIALLLLATVVQRLGDLSVEELQKGLTGVGVLLAEVAIFTRLLGKPEKMISTGVGLAILAGAMYLLVGVVKKFADMSLEEIQTGLIGLGGALLIITAAVRLMPKNLLFTAIGLIGIAAGLLIISQVIQDLGQLTWKQVGVGLATLAGALLILSVSLYAMSGTILGSVALVLAAGALTLLVPVLKTLGRMKISEIGTALLALVGIFALLAVAGIVLAPIVPILLGLGVAIALLGLGVALVGAGLLAFALGLSALAAGGTAAALVISGMVLIFLGLVPLIVTTIVDAIVSLATGIAEGAPAIFEAVKAMLLGFMQVIIDTTPKIMETLGVLLEALIELITEMIPDFVEAVIELLVTLLEEIAANVPDFIQAGFDILIAFLEGVRDNIGEVVTTAISIVTEFIDAVAEKIPDIIQSGWDLMIAFIDGMADGIDNNMQPALDAIGRLAVSIIEGLVKGISSNSWKVINALVQLAKDAWQRAKDWLLSRSPSKKFAELGETIPEGMAVGIRRTSKSVNDAVSDLGQSAIDGLSYAIATINSLIEDDINVDPTIRPVLDMTDIINGSKQIDTYLYGNKAINLIPVIATSSRIANGMTNAELAALGNTSIELTQNNYSPKALSRLEIRRQTRIQLLTLRGLLRP